MPHRSWSESRDHAIRFFRDPVHLAAESERAEKQTFWNAFFAAFEENVRNTRVRYKPKDEANEKAYARMCQLHDELRAGGFTGHEFGRGRADWR